MRPRHTSARSDLGYWIILGVLLAVVLPSDRGAAQVPPAETLMVSIAQPPDGSTFFTADPVTLQGTAIDAVDGDLSARLTWSSDIQGPLGTGAVITTMLNQGTHRVTASVTNSDGFIEIGRAHV